MKLFSFESISPRERTSLAVAAVFLVGTALWAGVYEPAVENRVALKKRIMAKTAELEESRTLVRQIAALKSGTARFENKLVQRPEDFSVITEMESLAQSSAVRENVVSMTPQRPSEVAGYKESAVELVMEKTPLSKLLRLLKSMKESQGLLRIKRITIKPQYKDPSMLDVAMTVAGYEKQR